MELEIFLLIFLLQIFRSYGAIFELTILLNTDISFARNFEKFWNSG